MKIPLTIIVLLLMPGAWALGIAPTQRDLEYGPETQRSVIKIINNDKKDLDVSLSVDGSLKEYIRLDETMIHMAPQDGEKAVGYSVRLPSTLEPGPNTGKIIAEETVPHVRFGDNYVSAKLTVVSQVSITIPYPDKYVDVRLDVVPVEKVINIKANIVNKGMKDIGSLAASFAVFDEGKTLMTYDAQAIALKRDATEDLIATFRTLDVQPGLYSAIATIGFDDRSLKLTREFAIGKPTIHINGFSTYFVEDTINEFPLDLESAWNKDIKNVFAEVFIFRNGKEITSFKGPSFDMASHETKRAMLYFTTKELSLGDYDAVVTLHYGAETAKKEQKIAIITRQDYETRHVEKGNNLVTYLVITNIALLIMFVLFFLLGRVQRLR